MTPPPLDDSAGRLARSLELAEGFVLGVVFGDAATGRAYVAQEIATLAASLGTPVTVQYPREPPSAAPAIREGERTVVVLDYGDRTRSIGAELGALNRRRDTLRQSPGLALVLVLPPDARAELASAAPDLWSIRSVTVALASPSISTDAIEPLRAWQQRCRAALEARIASQAGAAARYRHGVYSFAYRLDVREPLPLARLLETMRDIEGWTGWRPWWVPSTKHLPHVVEPGTLECWMFSDEQVFPDPAHSDFWRASAEGWFYLARGYTEDSAPERLEPGTRLSRSLPVWRTGEALHHAAQMAERLAADASPIAFMARWEGLDGRQTTSWPDGDSSDETGSGGASSQAFAESSVVTDRDQIERSLADVVGRLVRPLSDAFLDELSSTFIEAHLDKLRSRPAG